MGILGKQLIQVISEGNHLNSGVFSITVYITGITYSYITRAPWGYTMARQEVSPHLLPEKALALRKTVFNFVMFSHWHIR